MVKLYEYLTINVYGNETQFNINNLKNPSPDLIKIIGYSYYENGHGGEIFNISCDLFSHPFNGITSDIGFFINNSNSNFIYCNLKYNNFKRNLSGMHNIKITRHIIGANDTQGGANGVLILILQLITHE